MSAKKLGIVAALITVFTASSGTVLGQSESANKKEELVLEEIIVTAQKRVESIQDVPISIQVISDDRLKQYNLKSLLSLAETLPGVIVVPAGPSDSLFIRGVGSYGNPSFDQSVGLFIDEIYHGRSRSSNVVFIDLERIEILKGPQSTYFGNNAIAGAISVVTRKPGDEFEGGVSALYGTHDQYVIEGAAGGPISDTLSARVAVTYNGTGGWIENVDTGKKMPEIENLGGRVTLVYQPTDDLEATLKIEGSTNKLLGAGYGGSQQLIRCPAPSSWPRYFRACDTNAAAGVPIGFDTNQNIIDDTGQGIWLDTFETVLRLNYNKGDHTFTSVTGYYDSDYKLASFLDTVTTPFANRTLIQPEQAEQFSQEFRITSPTGQTIEYLAGAYFQTVQTDYYVGNNFVGLRGIGPSSPLFPHLPVSVQNAVDQGEDLYAIFGSLTWNVTDRLSLIAGLRGTWVDKDINVDHTIGTVSGPYSLQTALLPPDLAALAAPLMRAAGPWSASISRSDDAWLPSAKIQYQVTPDVMAYFSYSRGFKAGGFNGIDSSIPNDPSNLPYDPEYVNAWEGGFKSVWFDNQVLLNLSVFRMDYSDLQVGVVTYGPGGTLMRLVENAAESRSQGIEFEGQAVISEYFRVVANVTYLDAKYVDYPNAGPTLSQSMAGIPFQDLSGRPTPYSPEWSGSVTATLSVPLPNGYKFTAELAPFFTSSYFIRDLAEVVDDGRAFFWQSSYVRLDGRLTLESPDGRWALDVIGKNLTDRNILVSTTSPLHAGKLEPWNVAVQVRYLY